MKPKTRLEWFLAKIAGDTDATGSMTPRTRREYYLKEIADANASGGSGYDIVVSTENWLSETASDYTVTWDYPSVLAKVRNGELVTGVLVYHYNYDAEVDGDTSLFFAPLTDIDIFSNVGQLKFSQCKVSGWDQTYTTMEVYRSVMEIDVETGDVYEVSSVRDFAKMTNS